MTRVLIIERDTATEAISHLNDFVAKMEEFTTKHTTYSFESSVTKLKNDKWEVKVAITRNEQGNDTTT
jgi:hypothetical protein